MKGIHIVAIAFLASVITVIAANEDLGQDQSVSESYYIPTRCDYPEKRNRTIHLPHETDCTKFYKCAHGRPVEQDCPLMIKHDPYTRLHYNRFEQVCDWPWRAGCRSCPKPNEGWYPPSSSRISHRDNDCSMFWECSVHGGSQLNYCRSGMCFSRTCQRCVWKRFGGYCDNRDTRPPPDCKDGQLIKDKCNPSWYYECYNGKWSKIPTECRGGLHFDSCTQRCRLPNEIRCPYEQDSDSSHDPAILQ